MATRTLILRPIGGINVKSSQMIYPQDWPLDEAYKLINEEYADDDATYWIANTVSNMIQVYFSSLPEEYLNMTPKSIKICCRAKAIDSETATLSMSYYNDNRIQDGFKINPMETVDYTISSKYSNCNYEIPQENILDFYSGLSLDWSNSTYKTVAIVNVSSSNASKTGKVAVTQLYIEITYESSDEGDDTSEAIYIKENGSWVAITGTIYQKENGIWVEVDSSVLQDGTRYVIIKEI